MHAIRTHKPGKCNGAWIQYNRIKNDACRALGVTGVVLFRWLWRRLENYRVLP